MIKLLLTTALLAVSQLTFAINETIQIIDIDSPTNSSEAYLLFGDNGFVYELDQTKSELVHIALQATESDASVELTLTDDELTREILDTRSVVKDIKLLPTTNLQTKGLKFFSEEVVVAPLMNSYISDFSSEEEVQNLFSGLNSRTKRRSQCYNRAHVWSWDLYHQFHNGSRIQTGKVWIYFTKKYIREYGHKWWFHIAPYLTVNGEERVIDRSFSDKPESIQNWTNRFIKTQEVCPEVGLYSEYKSRIYTDNCLIMKSSVHYWQPHQLKNAELKGWEQTEWKKSELNKAYSNVFGWFSKAPKL